MFVTVVAVLCHINGIAVAGCVEEIVTDSNLTPEITFLECAIGAQAPLAKWMSEHPIDLIATNACRVAMKSRGERR
jgi:hypothetical protein